MGTGTQKAEDELHRLFPEAKIIRMDNDTTRTKNAHERLLHDFETSGDILLGTQMIAKGLDFPRVTLVGIIQADNNLFISDFRSAEKTFQLLMQVSGRSDQQNIPLHQAKPYCLSLIHIPSPRDATLSRMPSSA